MNSFFDQNASLLLENPELSEAFKRVMSFEKHLELAILQQTVKICNHINIITSGIARVFYNKVDKDIVVILLLKKK
ncbi:hypothetical protein OD91_2112 [Lutibacter sp. Hel_I_33_5]|uniref:hypothetical protein n=1 Tax=Lutibacter sp. Hel_I_33_5 TaxID=1566289 RepID=UPI0011A9B4FE|nr:hypothetical protein [Lutibacter sp. Hel_I_33_5]TVZ56812.1 hypothetical protein OD91_2112 [Lutibacter sp. Hel_I_33_5]